MDHVYFLQAEKLSLGDPGAGKKLRILDESKSLLQRLIDIRNGRHRDRFYTQ